MPSQAAAQAMIVLCTCPDEDCARRLASGLVEARLAACVNIQPGIRSIYRWQEKLEEEAETLMIIKTTGARYAKLEAWLNDRHPYQLPEVLAMPVTAGSAPYLAWLSEETS